MNYAQNVSPVSCIAVLTILSFLCESVAKKKKSIGVTNTKLSSLFNKADQMFVEIFECTFVARCVFFFTFPYWCSQFLPILIWHHRWSRFPHCLARASTSVEAKPNLVLDSFVSFSNDITANEKLWAKHWLYYMLFSLNLTETFIFLPFFLFLSVIWFPSTS